MYEATEHWVTVFMVVTSQVSNSLQKPFWLHTRQPPSIENGRHSCTNWASAVYIAVLALTFLICTLHDECVKCPRSIFSITVVGLCSIIITVREWRETVCFFQCLSIAFNRGMRSLSKTQWQQSKFTIAAIIRSWLIFMPALLCWWA